MWWHKTSPGTPPKKITRRHVFQKHWGAPTLCLSSPFVPAGHEWREPRQKCGAWTTKRSWVMLDSWIEDEFHIVPLIVPLFLQNVDLTWLNQKSFALQTIWWAEIGCTGNWMSWKWPVNLSFSWLTWLNCDPLWPILVAPWPAQIWLSQPVAISQNHWDPGVKRWSSPAYLLTFAGLESFCILEYLGLRGEDCLDERWAAPSTLQDQHSQTCLAVAALLVGWRSAERRSSKPEIVSSNSAIVPLILQPMTMAWSRGGENMNKLKDERHLKRVAGLAKSISKA